MPHKASRHAAQMRRHLNLGRVHRGALLCEEWIGHDDSLGSKFSCVLGIDRARAVESEDAEVGIYKCQARSSGPTIDGGKHRRFVAFHSWPVDNHRQVSHDVHAIHLFDPTR